MKARHTIISTITLLGFVFLVALLVGATSCEAELFRCDGIDYSTGGPLCHCVADGLLCGHEGFGGCLSCEVPR